MKSFVIILSWFPPLTMSPLDENRRGGRVLDRQLIYLSDFVDRHLLLYHRLLEREVTNRAGLASVLRLCTLGTVLANQKIERLSWL